MLDTINDCLACCQNAMTPINDSTEKQAARDFPTSSSIPNVSVSIVGIYANSLTDHHYYGGFAVNIERPKLLYSDVNGSIGMRASVGAFLFAQKKTYDEKENKGPVISGMELGVTGHAVLVDSKFLLFTFDTAVSSSMFGDVIADAGLGLAFLIGSGNNLFISAGCRFIYSPGVIRESENSENILLGGIFHVGGGF